MILTILAILILGFIVFNFYTDYSNWANTGNTFAEGMENNQIILNNFFADKTINQNVSGSQKLFETSAKTIPEDIGNKVELDYEFKVRDQGWGNNTYGKMAIVNITQDKTTNLKSGKGRGTQVHKGTVDITEYVNPGDSVKMKFYTSRYTSGHTMYWFYFKNLNLKYTKKVTTPAAPAPAAPASAVTPSAEETTTDEATTNNNIIPASTWKSGGTCPVGCSEPICVDGNCKDVTVNGEVYKGCSGTCKNYNNEEGCSYDNQCTAEACGIKYYPLDDKTPCNQNQQSNNSMLGASGSSQPVQAIMQSGMIPQQQMGQQQMGQQQMGQQQMGQQQIQQQQQLQMGQQSSGISAGSVRQQEGPVGQASAVISNTSFSNPKNFTLFNEQILQRVLANKNLIPEDIPLNAEDQSSLIRVGRSFMLDVAKIRNLVLPNIRQNDYEILGRIVSKHLKDKEDGATRAHLDVTKSRIMNTVQALLSSTELNSSIIQNGTIPQSQTSNRTTGMMSDKTNAHMTGKGNYDFAKGMNGMSGKYTDSYKPTNDTINPKPYDSVWSVFY